MFDFGVFESDLKVPTSFMRCATVSWFALEYLSALLSRSLDVVLAYQLVMIPQACSVLTRSLTRCSVLVLQTTYLTAAAASSTYATQSTLANYDTTSDSLAQAQALRDYVDTEITVSQQLHLRAIPTGSVPSTTNTQSYH